MVNDMKENKKVKTKLPNKSLFGLQPDKTDL